MKSSEIAVVGATGLVGRKVVQVLEERLFPVKKLRLLASERSAGRKLGFRGDQITVEKLTPDSFEGINIAIFSAGSAVSKEYAPEAVKRNTIVIDNSSAYRMDKNVPLVVPEVNREETFRHKGIIANPNCSTIQLVVALKPLHDVYGVGRVVVSTYQSVSGAGKSAMDRLDAEINNIASSNITSSQSIFPHPIAYNCIPHIDILYEDGITKEEWKMSVETKKIFGDQSIDVTATCVRVPVYVGHSEAVNVELRKKYDVEEVKSLLSKSAGIVIMDNPDKNLYPLPLIAAESDNVYVGRIRRDPTLENGLNLWIVADNLRKGAATNTVQIAEVLLSKR